MNYIIRMRNLREDNDLTQQEIATVLGTSQTMYARYERGANELPIRHLITLAKYVLFLKHIVPQGRQSSVRGSGCISL